MARLLFEKTGNGIWISHLDLMRVFQRAFKRAGLPLRHTQGYNPRPSVSIALPLSVGVSSACELLDFDLDGEQITCEQIRDRLNSSLVSGVRVREVYENGRKLRDLSLLRVKVSMEYDHGITEDTVHRIRQLFSRDSLLVTKKSKNGSTEQDVILMIRKLEISGDGNTIILNALIHCQNPSLNPVQLVAAVERYLPEAIPDHAVICRLEIYDSNEEIFR